MSHDHSVEENPKTVSSGAFYFVLLLVGLVLGLFIFVQQMSAHGEEGHDDHATAADKDGHTWAADKDPFEYSTVAMTAGKVQEVKATTPAVVVVSDSVAVTATPATDSVTVEKK